MKKTFLYLCAITLLLNSCCTNEPVEVARFELDAKEKALIPYEYGQNKHFIHSNGYEFDFKVAMEKTEWLEHHDFCEWSCCNKDYYSYQLKYVKLESDYPLINITLTVGGNLWGDYYPEALFVDFNRNSLMLQYDLNDSLSFAQFGGIQFFDSLTLGNKMHYQVYAKDFDSNYFADTSVLNAKTLYYNSTGILQIKMTNDETFTIKN